MGLMQRGEVVRVFCVVCVLWFWFFISSVKTGSFRCSQGTLSHFDNKSHSGKNPAFSPECDIFKLLTVISPILFRQQI